MIFFAQATGNGFTPIELILGGVVATFAGLAVKFAQAYRAEVLANSAAELSRAAALAAAEARIEAKDQRIADLEARLKRWESRDA